jgi:hypothetical protein
MHPVARKVMAARRQDYVEVFQLVNGDDMADAVKRRVVTS